MFESLSEKTEYSLFNERNAEQAEQFVDFTRITTKHLEMLRVGPVHKNNYMQIMVL